jgi:hypothetical protein
MALVVLPTSRSTQIYDVVPHHMARESYCFQCTQQGRHGPHSSSKHPRRRDVRASKGLLYLRGTNLMFPNDARGLASPSPAPASIEWLQGKVGRRRLRPAIAPFVGGAQMTTSSPPPPALPLSPGDTPTPPASPGSQLDGAVTKIWA